MVAMCFALKSDSRLCSIPVVVLATSRDPADVGDCYSLGAKCISASRPTWTTSSGRSARECGEFTLNGFRNRDLRGSASPSLPRLQPTLVAAQVGPAESFACSAPMA